MSRSTGSVRIGPISLMTLLFTICLAVLAVLSLTTANATYAAAQKQAESNVETYANEDQAQRLVADVDAVLANVRAVNGGKSQALAALKAANLDKSGSSKASSSKASSSASDSDEGSTVEAKAKAKVHVKVNEKSSSVTATFTQDSGKKLAITLVINDDATYSIAKWQTSTLWKATDDKDKFWTPGKQ